MEEIEIPKGAAIRYMYKGEWEYAIMLDNPLHQVTGTVWPKEAKTVFQCVWKNGRIIGRKRLVKS